MVGVAGPQGGEHSGGGATASGAPSSADLVAIAQQATGTSSDSTNVDQYPIYAYSTNVTTDQYGDVRRGVYIPRDVSLQNATQYQQFIIGLQDSNNTLYRQYQTMLYQSGYYGSGKPVYGTYTGRDGQAIQNMIQDYEQYNTSLIAGGSKQVSPVGFMQRQIKIGGAALAGGGGPTKQPLTIQYTDPAVLRQTLQSAAQKNLGRDLTKKEMEGFISEFHGKEASAQKTAYDNGSSVTPPDASAEGADYIDQSFTMEEGQRRAATLIDSLNQMLGVL